MGYFSVITEAHLNKVEKTLFLFFSFSRMEDLWNKIDN